MIILFGFASVDDVLQFFLIDDFYSKIMWCLSLTCQYKQILFLKFDSNPCQVFVENNLTLEPEQCTLHLYLSFLYV